MEGRTKRVVAGGVVHDSYPSVRIEQRATDHIDRMLVELGMVSSVDLAAAARYGEHLGVTARAVLAAEGTITQDELAEAVVAATGHLRGSVDGVADALLLSRFDEAWSRRSGAVPLRVEGARLVVAVAEPLPPVVEEALVHAYDDLAGVHQLVVTTAELDRARQDAYRDHYLHNALRAPGPDALRPAEASGRATRTLRFAVVAGLGAVALALTAAFAVPGAALVITGLVAAVAILATGVVFVLGEPLSREERAVGNWAMDHSALRDAERPPTYTILAPVGADLADTSRLIRGIQALDYPACLLDVKLLCREDDPIAVSLTGLMLPPQFRVIRVPSQVPQTVSGLRNYGLTMAEGDYTIGCAPGRLPTAEQLRRPMQMTPAHGGRTTAVRAVGGWAPQAA